MNIPEFIQVFMMPVRDNLPVQAALFAVLVLVFADMVFGIANACMQKKFSSSELRKGLLHKMGELAIILVGIVIDGLIFAGLDLGFSGPILVVTLASIIRMEVGSLLELSAKMNPGLGKLNVFKLLASVDTHSEERHAETD